MELAEIISRLEFIETERRKTKTSISALEKHIQSLEISQARLKDSIKENATINNEIGSFSEKITQFDESLSKLRTELMKSIKLSESQSKARETIKEKIRIGELDGLKKEVEKIKKESSLVKDLKKSHTAQGEETQNLSTSISELRNKIEKNDIKIDETAQIIKSYLSMQKRDAKRSAEIQGQFELTQKVVEEQIARINLTNETIRKLDIKLADYQAKENQRQQELINTLDKAKLLQVDQQNHWKDWESRFIEIENNNKNVQNQLLTLEVTLKDLRKVQATFTELNEKLDRRINEITEMQRLGDDRMRKEWLNFKADDQKRWTVYALAQEELHRGTGSEVINTKDKLQAIDDEISQLKTLLGLLGNENQKQFRVIIDVVNNLLEANDRTLGILDK